MLPFDKFAQQNRLNCQTLTQIVNYTLFMQVYIEDFLFQNMLINFCLLRLVQVTTKSKTSFFLLYVSSLIYAGINAISTGILHNNLLINIVKFVGFVVMLKLCFKSNFKQFIAQILLLYAYSFALCGVTLSFGTSQKMTSFGVIVASKVNMWLIVASCIGFTYLFEAIAKHIKFKLQINNLVYPITLKLQNHTVNINAFLDTGNMLNLNGKPVLILDLSSYLKLSKQNYVEYILNSSEHIQTSTITGKNNLKIFELDLLKIKINGKLKQIEKPLVAVNCVDKFDKTGYQALISPAFL